MSINITTNKTIKLGDLKTKLGLSLMYTQESNLWIGFKDTDKVIQILGPGFTGIYLKDQDIGINEYCIRQDGGKEIIRDLAVVFQSKFLDDNAFMEYFMTNMDKTDEEFEFIEKSYDEIFRNTVMPQWGLEYDESGNIKKKEIEA